MYNCHVRIYVETNASGNVLRTNANTGHFDLQIDGVDSAPIVINGHSFTNPVFSYNSEGLRIFNGSVHPLTNCKMYTFDFTASDEAVNDFIVTKMLNTYLGLASETADELTGGYLYPVISGPFQEYDINSTNCFTATAYWCKWLGYNTLYNIANAADSYTDYLAWRMYDRYGHAWTYIGQF